MKTKRTAYAGFGKTAILLLAFCLAASALLAPAAAPAEKSVIGDSLYSLDLSEIGEGCVLVRAAAGSARLKLLITLGDETLTVDQNNKGEWQRHNLYFGRGLYTFSLCENVGGNRYRILSVLQADNPSDCLNNWLAPNDHVRFAEDSRITALADSLCEGLDSRESVFRKISSYIEKNFIFDYIAFYKTARLDYEVPPDINGLLDTKMGLCKDISAAVVAMLRSQGVPAVMAYGFGDGVPHAWVIVDLDGRKIVYDPTARITGGKVENYRLVRVY